MFTMHSKCVATLPLFISFAMFGQQHTASFTANDFVPFEMLIDRIYTIKTKQQIFGSQSGYPLADEKTRAAVKQEYGLE